MKTRVLLFILFVATLSAAGTLVTVLFNTAPNTREVIALFYTALMVTVFGLVFFTSYGVSALRFQGIPDWQSTVAAMRIGLVASVFLAILAAIQSVQLLNTATFIILIILAIAGELILRKRLILKNK
jgi:hypothetical protein